MSADFLDALKQIEKEKEIPFEQLVSTIESALETAYKKHFATIGDVRVRVVVSKNGFHVYCQKTVVETLENPHTEIALDDARNEVSDAHVGDMIEIEVTPANFGRIAAQTAKQVVMQRIREAEREKAFEEFNEKIGDVLNGTVQRIDPRNIYIDLGKIEAILPTAEQVATEHYDVNMRLKVYILDVRKTPKGPQVIVSRTHPSLIRGLFELEVPEINDNVVKICSVAREAGARTKIAVFSEDPNVDAMGACVGHRGLRVQSIVTELFNEKVDIIRWSDKMDKFISEALSPAKVVSVKTDYSAKAACVIVPDNQLSLAIGKAGQNVRLAARLTGWRIDIHSETQASKSEKPNDEASDS